jgi:hypothetical protein
MVRMAAAAAGELAAELSSAEARNQVGALFE